MENKLKKLKEEILNQLEKVNNIQVLRNLEIKYLGRKGELTKILKELVSLSEAEKKSVGLLANNLKVEVTNKFNEIKELVESGGKEEFIDITLPGDNIKQGHLHPITILQYELEDLFSSMGFMVLDGPELESDYYNFTALNVPYYHPARDIQDTFYINHYDKDNQFDLVMRTQTSPMQVRAMQKYGVPIKCVVPGRVFRCEATDACHEHTFYQMEGLMVDKNISISNMIIIMKELINHIFKGEIETRIRPGYFPFVEPAIEMDIRCTICHGSGCPACKNSGWLEILPGGMVHPNVLRYGGVDPEKYSGFAFGLGLTRLAMMKYGINDIRLFMSGDLRFIEQF